jgi:Zn-dependent peptidase ImmA (M78 family)
MTQAQVNMASLYDRLNSLGFPKTFVREKALPDWWDDEFEATPGSVIEAAAYISRRLNLEIDSLLQPDRSPSFNQSCQAKFKTKQGTQIEQLFLAQCMAARIAEMVAYACIPEFKPLPTSVQQVRDEILNLSEIDGQKTQKFVNLDGLLNWCWQAGIPVVHFDRFPQKKGIHKFQGMVSYFYGRPVIILSLSYKFTARLLFILAHELGHLVKGHINGASLLDEEIEPVSEDNEEIEANDFAVELLLGRVGIAYYSSRYISGEQLANNAYKVSEQDNIDPGVIILHYAWMKAKHLPSSQQQGIVWATANKALKLIEGNIDATKLINRYLKSHLDWDRLDNDSQDYLSLAVEG